MAELKELLTKLGHYYDNAEGSGIAKLFYSHATRIDEIRAILSEIQENRYLDTAFGYSLDLIGAELGVGRDQDEVDLNYRSRLRLEIMQLINQGTLEEIRTIIAEAMSIPPEMILIYNNEAPSVGLIDLPYYVEVSVHTKHLPKEGFEHGFKFSGSETESTFDSVLGFDAGVLVWEITPAQKLTEVEELLERILPTGVQFQIAVHGGFKFSADPIVSEFDSERGFNSGGWRGGF